MIFGSKKARRLHQLRVRDAYRALMGADKEAAKIVMQDLALACHANTPTEVPGDTHATSHNNGKRRVYMHIYSQLEMTDDRLDMLYGSADEHEDDVII